MDAGAVVAIVVAVVVPLVTFGLALRLDQVRWLREQRAETYVDMLTEVYAQRQWFEYETADGTERESMRNNFNDLRLPEFERARLGSRGTVFGSREVNILFNRFGSVFSQALLIRPKNEAERGVNRVLVGVALNELENAIKRELLGTGLNRRRDVFRDAVHRGWERGGGQATPTN
jgi:hypothetical protein